MKKLTLAVLGIAFMASFMSCKKCLECSIASSGTTVGSTEEYCEKKKDRDKAEDEFMDACETLKAFDPSVTCECKEK